MQPKYPSMLANSGQDSQAMAKFRKLPCIFPVSRETHRRDEFASDCVHHHPLSVELSCRTSSRNSGLNSGA